MSSAPGHAEGEHATRTPPFPPSYLLTFVTRVSKADAQIWPRPPDCGVQSAEEAERAMDLDRANVLTWQVLEGRLGREVHPRFIVLLQ